MAKRKQSKSKSKNSEWLDEIQDAQDNEELKAKYDEAPAKIKPDIDFSKKHSYREGQIVSCPNKSKNYNAAETATGTIAHVTGDMVSVLDSDGLLHWVKAHELWTA